MIDLSAWLGPAADEMTSAQTDEYEAIAAELTARYPDPADIEELTASMSSALQYILGETTLHQAAENLASARRAEHAAMAALGGVTLAAYHQGVTEAELVRALGVARETVRKVLGK